MSAETTSLSAKADPAHRGARLLRYSSTRLLNGLLVALGAYTISYIILYFLPSDPVEIMLQGGGDGLYVTPEQVEAARRQYGLDGSPLAQYLTGLLRIASGSLGDSIQFSAPVAELISRALPPTLALAVLAGIGAALLGAGIALLAHLTRNPALRVLLEALPPLGASVPVFWVGLLLLQAFSFGFRIFPPMGNDSLASLVLPALALSVPSAASIAQVLSRNLAEALTQPYCKYARMKGCTHAQVVLRYAFKNALPPVVGMLGVIIGGLLTGAVVTETVFTREGLGRLTERAVTFQDIPLVQGIVLFCAVVFIVVTLVADLLVLLLDPRTRRTLGGVAS